MIDFLNTPITWADALVFCFSYIVLWILEVAITVVKNAKNNTHKD